MTDKISLILNLFYTDANSGLDNKITVYPLSADDDVQTKKKHVGTHTSYMSCCMFPGFDQQIITGSGDSTCALWVSLSIGPKVLLRFIN